MAPEKVPNDVERQNGDANETAEWRNRVDARPNEDEDLEEYAGLVKYISTYRDGRRQSSVAQGQDQEQKKVPWYTPWKRGKKTDAGEFEIPIEWLDTDMSSGLKDTDIEHRRKKHGWNELTSEQTNLFIQFLSYFTGPILYGKNSSQLNMEPA